MLLTTTTYRPSAERLSFEGTKTKPPVPSLPSLATETRSTAPVRRSRTKMSSTPLCPARAAA
jgi:hypothetical protein